MDVRTEALAVLRRQGQVSSALAKPAVKKTITANGQTAKTAGEKEKAASAAAALAANFRTYADFSAPLRSLRSHQTLALRRGTASAALAVKLTLPEAALEAAMLRVARLPPSAHAAYDSPARAQVLQPHILPTGFASVHPSVLPPSGRRARRRTDPPRVRQTGSPVW
jgi:hypothetical protein